MQTFFNNVHFYAFRPQTWIRSTTSCTIHGKWHRWRNRQKTCQSLWRRRCRGRMRHGSSGGEARSPATTTWSTCLQRWVPLCNPIHCLLFHPFLLNWHTVSVWNLKLIPVGMKATILAQNHEKNPFSHIICKLFDVNVNTGPTDQHKIWTLNTKHIKYLLIIWLYL